MNKYILDPDPDPDPDPNYDEFSRGVWVAAMLHYTVILYYCNLILI